MASGATPEGIRHGRIEMDTHADTIVFGRNFVPMSFSGRECDVSPFTDSYNKINSVPIASAATAWTSSDTGTTYILVFHEGLWMPEQMEHSLINPNQLRYFGTVVQDNPYSKSPLFIMTEDSSFVLPLDTIGTNIVANTRTPTSEELDLCQHVHLNSRHPWDPQKVVFPLAARSVQEEMDARLVGSVQRTQTMADCEGTTPLFSIDRLCAAISSLPTGPTAVVGAQRTFESKARHSSVTPVDLSERWGIGIKQAAETLQRTTQRIVRSAVLPLGRRYKADRYYEKKRLDGKWYTDTMDGRTISLSGNRYGQVFVNKLGFAVIYPMDSKVQAGEALRLFCQEYGVPQQLTYDGSREQTGKKTEFMKQVRKHDIDYHIIEPFRHNQNQAEGVIREIRRRLLRVMARKKVPAKLWDYCAKWTCEVMQRTFSRTGRLDACVPLERITGETIDISEYLDFGFYDWVWYHENAGLGERKIGRWLGIPTRVGSAMTYQILTNSGQVICRTTVQRVTDAETQTTEVQQQMQRFDDCTKSKLHGSDSSTTGSKTTPADWADLPDFDQEFVNEYEAVISNEEIPEADVEYTPEVLDDTYLNMELALPRDGPEPQFARVTKRLRDTEGRPIGRAHDNPILDSRVYEVEYSDGHKASMAANAIAMAMFAQVDEEGNRHVLFDEIIDNRTNGAEVKQQDAFLITPSGNRRRRKTTQGWELLVAWKDGSSTWVPLKDMKDSYPTQTADYATAMRLAAEPAFAWWVPDVIKKRDRIIAKVKSKYWLRTHKFGIRVPKTVEEAKRLDQENGNTLWWDAICKEMRNVRIAFEVFDGNEKEIPPGYQRVNCHIIFDVKMGENFRRKARMVAGGHTTEAPATLTYSSVVSRDSVRIALTIAALNDLQVLACDIQNAYLTAKCREKIYTIAGPEFGSERGKIMLVVRALYGLKSSGAAFRAFLADTLYDSGYRSSKADPDVWMRKSSKPDGFSYYEYVLCYVDDVLAISHEPGRTMDSIRKTFKLKEDKAEEPDVYLGASLSKMTNGSGTECWTISSEKYVRAAVANVEGKLDKEGKRLPSRCQTPFTSGYKPEQDDTPELKADGLHYYQELIGVLRWAVELGRVDILLETSLLSAHLALPRIGHLEQAIHIFGYLKENPKRQLMMDSDHPHIDERRFQKFDWFDFYRDAKESLPGDMPEPLGNMVSTHCFVDANHAGNTSNRRSQTGILIFVNRAPVLWYSKRQNTVEASTFGSEITAMKNAIELIEGIRYKLRMFGVPIEGPTNIFCDNEAVYKNCSVPESTLKKKHHSIAYHRNREAVAAGTCRIAKEGTETNLSDLFTKALPRIRREHLLDRFTY